MMSKYVKKSVQADCSSLNIEFAQVFGKTKILVNFAALFGKAKLNKIDLWQVRAM
jgi:hypothetical protein